MSPMSPTDWQFDVSNKTGPSSGGWEAGGERWRKVRKKVRVTGGLLLRWMDGWSKGGR